MRLVKSSLRKLNARFGRLCLRSRDGDLLRSRLCAFGFGLRLLEFSLGLRNVSFGDLDLVLDLAGSGLSRFDASAGRVGAKSAASRAGARKAGSRPAAKAPPRKHKRR